jgi:hypothetical protein
LRILRLNLFCPHGLIRDGFLEEKVRSQEITGMSIYYLQQNEEKSLLYFCSGQDDMQMLLFAAPATLGECIIFN